MAAQLNRLFVKATLGLATAAVLVLSACGMARTKSDQLDDNLRAYAGAIRWGAISEAVAFIDPKTLEQKPISRFDLDRFAQFRVVGYRVQNAPVIDQNNTARQQVIIEFVNKHTQNPRAVLDNQVWQFDAELKRWVLLSGLPNMENTVDEPQ